MIQVNVCLFDEVGFEAEITLDQVSNLAEATAIIDAAAEGQLLHNGTAYVRDFDEQNVFDPASQVIVTTFVRKTALVTIS